MKKLIIAASLLVAACGQSSTTTTTTTAAAPEGLMEQTLAQSQEMRPVAATQALMTYQAAHPESLPRCTEIREAAERGVIPDNVAEGSIYKPFAGSLVFAVQCGARLTTVRPDPHEHWLVVMAPGAPDATVISCVDARGADACINTMPRAAATTTTAP